MAKKPRRTPRVKSRRKTLENKLDTLSAKICRKQGYCTTCGKKDCVLNAHHFKSRLYKGTRWYQPNLICLCVHCHTFSFKFSAHKTPEAFKEKMLELKGEDWLNDINTRAMSHTSWRLPELEELLEEMEKDDN